MSKVYAFHIFDRPDTQKLIDRPAPQPGPGELAVNVRAAGVNPVDWKIRSGALGTDLALPAPMARKSPA